jgi:hypothetical protein
MGSLPLGNVVFVLVCLAVALLLVRHRGQRLPDQKNKDIKTAFPWWYYIGIGIACILVLGPFKNVVKLMGWFLFIIIAGAGMNRQLKNK